jgi:hypothetical protein
LTAAADHSTSFLLDKLGKNGIDIEDTKSILAETVEALLGEPIIGLIDRKRRAGARLRISP